MGMLRRLFQDESAQATTEYMLMLAVAITIAVAMIKKVLQPAYDRLKVALADQLEKNLFGGNMHSLKVGH